MSNTAKRIISAIVIMAIVFFCIWKGRFSTLTFTLVAGVLSIDEICRNLLSHKRFSLPYLLNQSVFLAAYIFTAYIENLPGYYIIGINVSLIINVFLMIFLFQPRTGSEKVFNYLRTSMIFQILPAVLILFPILSLTSIYSSADWVKWLIVFFFVNFGMDTGAWFFGRKFGKRKLWEAVSPKKTVEGTVGGVFAGAFLAFLYLYVSNGSFPPIYLFAIFALIAAASQLGDLFQSKLKRIADIKDSSGLIPGHGGVYDRIDSLLFSVPIFAVLLPWFIRIT